MSEDFEYYECRQCGFEYDEDEMEDYNEDTQVGICLECSKLED